MTERHDRQMIQEGYSQACEELQSICQRQWDDLTRVCKDAWSVVTFQGTWLEDGLFLWDLYGISGKNYTKVVRKSNVLTHGVDSRCLSMLLASYSDC